MREQSNSSVVRTRLLSELLVFWDAPNKLGGYGNGKSGSTGGFSLVTGGCPASFTFKSVLPTHYTESDGERTPLPPSFASALPGFQCDIRYEFRIRITRVYDVKVKMINRELLSLQREKRVSITAY